MGTKMESLDEYRFDLRDGLRVAARAGLTQLEEMINDVGYSWLDGYMESVMSSSSSSRAPMAELMKTPSRTHTVKKTRAALTAAKEKTERIKKLNLSPMPKSPLSRQPFSPLQPRSVNTTPRQAALSPSKPAKHGNQLLVPTPSKAIKSRSPKQPSPARQVSPKKVKHASKENEQQSRLESIRSAAPVPPSSPSRIKPPSTKAMRDKPEHDVEVQIPPLDADKETSDAHQDDNVAQVLDDTPILVAPETETTRDTQDAVFASSSKVIEPARQYNDIEKVSAPPSEVTVAAVLPAAPEETRFPPTSSTAPIPSASHPPASAPLANLAKRQTGASVSEKEVRYSWLAKALGTGSAAAGQPGVQGPESSVLRRSIAPVQSAPIDFSAVRKSLLPPGGLKRKSEAAESTIKELEETKRPEKMLRVDNDAQPSSREKSMSVATPFNRLTTSTHPALESDSKINRASVSQPLQSAQPEKSHSDIRRVTQALDDIRDKQSARAALGASVGASGPRSTAPIGIASSTSALGSSQSGQPATGSGFLRGLSNLGKSWGIGGSALGGSAKDAEEGALKLRQELQEDEADEVAAEAAAQAELDKIIAETKSKPVVPTPGPPSRPQKFSLFPIRPAEDVDAVPKESVPVAQDASTNATAQLDPEPEVVVSVKDNNKADSDVEDEDEIVEGLSRVISHDDDKEDAEMDKTDDFVTALQAQVPTAQTPSPKSKAPAKASQMVAVSTTPMMSPPRTVKTVVQTTSHRQSPQGPSPIRIQARAPQSPVKPPKSPLRSLQQPKETVPPVPSMSLAKPLPVLKPTVAAPQPAAPARIEVEDEADESVDLPELPEGLQTDSESDHESDEQEEVEDEKLPAKNMFKSDHASLSQSVSNKHNPLNASTASNTGSMFGQASLMASKTLGFKPTTGPVKSIQMAQSIAKKEQATNERRKELREQAEQRKIQAAKKKAEEDRIKAEEDKKARAIELEEKRKIRLENERKRKEREERIAAAAKEKEDKEAALRKAEEDASKKRKLAAAALNKSGPVKKMALSSSTSTQVVVNKPKDAQGPMRTIKPIVNLVSASTSTSTSVCAAGPSKLGPTVFRTAQTAESSTFSAQPTAVVIQPQEKRPLGPPSRPSQQPAHGQSSQHVPLTQQNLQALGQGSKASGVLQQSRIALVNQLEDKANLVQSEDIELPDIASEYSDSDDSEKSDDFKRPGWAESPELRAALEAQSRRDPDELFGPIKPISMEELFKVRHGKFRNRTSSANWSKGDGLTKLETVEYAKRMNFKPVGKFDSDVL